MKINILLILVFFNVLYAIGQNLPKEIRFSPDGLRLISGGNPSSGLYDETKVRSLELKFTQPDYWQQLLNNYQSKTDIPATLLFDGKEYQNVGVRFKGQTSFQRVTTQKKSFNITMDFMDSTQTLKGYQTINLNNSYEDNSFMREVFYENITSGFHTSLKANYVHLIINGESWGLYPNIQALDGEYIKEWFLSNDGTRWRCERTTPGGGGAGGFGAGTSTLNYLGEDTSLYKPHYKLKNTNKSNPWTDLVTATRVLNQTPLNLLEDSLKKVLDIDRALWFLAKEIVFGDDDGYVNKGGMDYYAYWDVETNRLIPLEYDANSVMGNMTSSWTPFQKENDTKYPLMNKLFKVPELRQRYIAHVRTVLKEVLDSAIYTQKLNNYYTLIDSFVKADTKKLMTYPNFTAAKNEIPNWLRTRRNNFLNHPEIKVEAPVIEYAHYVNINYLINTPPNEAETVHVISKSTHSLGIQFMNLYYSTGYDGYFTKTAMLDDGLHQDGIAGDGVFGGEIPAFTNGQYVRYYVGAAANNTNKTISYFPEGAEHDVFIYRVNLIQSPIQNIVINEFMASNTKSVSDQDGEFDDWIELHNTGNIDIDISKWVLTDNPDNLDKYVFPDGTILSAHGYLVVWADEDGNQQGFHANFKLSAAGESIILLDPSKQMADMITYPLQTSDISYARIPNGTGPFIFQNHSFNKSNDIVSVINNHTGSIELICYPNPVKDVLHVTYPDSKNHTLQIINTMGKVLWKDTFFERTQIQIENFIPGLYVITLGDKHVKIWVE